MQLLIGTFFFTYTYVDATTPNWQLVSHLIFNLSSSWRAEPGYFLPHSAQETNRTPCFVQCNKLLFHSLTCLTLNLMMITTFCMFKENRHNLKSKETKMLCLAWCCSFWKGLIEIVFNPFFFIQDAAFYSLCGKHASRHFNMSKAAHNYTEVRINGSWSSRWATK